MATFNNLFHIEQRMFWLTENQNDAANMNSMTSIFAASNKYLTNYISSTNLSIWGFFRSQSPPQTSAKRVVNYILHNCTTLFLSNAMLQECALEQEYGIASMWSSGPSSASG